MSSQNLPEPSNTTNPSQTALVVDVVRDVVADVAPEELPIVNGLAALDHDHAVRQMRKRPRKHEQLGFGLGEVAVLVTPILWLALDEAAKQLTGEAVKATGRGTKAALRRVFRRAGGPAVLPAMNERQREVLHQGVITTALEQGLPKQQARQLADALISRIATGRTAEPPSIEPER